jgi:hypothetical protein
MSRLDVHGSSWASMLPNSKPGEADRVTCRFKLPFVPVLLVGNLGARPVSAIDGLTLHTGTYRHHGRCLPASDIRPPDRAILPIGCAWKPPPSFSPE